MNPTPPCQSDAASGVKRRLFLWLTAAVSAAAATVLATPLFGYFLGQRKNPIHWVKLGPAADFPPNETRLVTFDNPIRQPWDGKTAHTGVFVRNQNTTTPGQEFLVLAMNCAHLGCPVSWFPQSGLFMCPCHGGVYYADGERASGPPPRGLFHCVWRITNGELEVQAPHYPTLQDTLKENDE